MNIWKPIALCSIAGLVISLGVQTASAGPMGGECKNQPNMQAALDHLRGAKASLDKAEHNKGGWRDAAVTAVEAAIRENTKGCTIP